MSYDSHTIERQRHQLTKKDVETISLLYNSTFKTAYQSKTEIFYDFFRRYTTDEGCALINKNMEAENQAMMAIAFNLLDHFEVLTNVTVYRAFNLKDENVYNNILCSKGFIFNRKFLSTTTSQQLALNWGSKYLIKISIKKAYGLKLRSISKFREEDEILLPCFSYIRIIDVIENVFIGELEPLDEEHYPLQQNHNSNPNVNQNFNNQIAFSGNQPLYPVAQPPPYYGQMPSNNSAPISQNNQNFSNVNNKNGNFVVGNNNVTSVTNNHTIDKATTDKRNLQKVLQTPPPRVVDSPTIKPHCIIA